MKPTVSIIMPVLNGEKFIREAIDSIVAQSYTNHELIVVDDGSTDRTAEIAKSYAKTLDVKFVHHTAPQGITSSMNDGVRRATGELISFLDHDDAWCSDFLETQVAYLGTHPEVAMVHSDFQTTDVDGNVIEESVAACRERTRPSGYVFPRLFMDSFIVGNSVLIRKECFTRLGLFDESLRWGDYHMWMRIARHYRVDYVPKVLTKYRQHPGQSTRIAPTGRTGEESTGLQAVKKILELYPEIWQELGEKTIRRRMASLYFDLAYSWWSKGAARHARICLSKAMRLWPTNLQYCAMYAATLIRPSHANAIRKMRRRARGLFAAGQAGSEPLNRATKTG